jgi:dTDP-glucose 4,6-dehydratase
MREFGMKRILLTGASGFVGSHVLRHILATTDWFVVCPVTFKHKGIQDRIRLSIAGNENYASRIKVLNCDLAFPISSITAQEFGPIDYVLNVASESHVDRSIEYPKDFIINNVSLICNLLDWARITNPEKIIHISTDEVYGPAPKGYAHREWVDQYFPSNPYSASKAAQESIVFSYWRTYGLPIMITNTMNLIGEMQDPEKFLPMTMSKILKGETVTIHGSLEGEIGSRFYLHARNQADALLYLLNADFPKYGQSQHPEKFHIVGEREVNNLELAQSIAHYLNKPLKYEIVDFHTSRPGHDLRYALDGSKLAAAGWSAPVALEDSIHKTLQWNLDHPEWLKI